MPDSPLSLDLVVSVADNVTGVPAAALLERACLAALEDRRGAYAVGLRVADELESSRLNAQYRRRDGATNVLSFPAGVPVGEVTLLGDLVLCGPVLEREARTHGKSSEHHWLHLVVHGMLHLLGFDHVDAREAQAMEAVEIRCLAALGVADPYA